MLILNMETLLLKIITDSHRFYIDGKSKTEVFDYLLTQLLEITQSEYGFIGRILYKNNMPFLRTYAITNIAWTDELKEQYKKIKLEDIVFSMLDNNGEVKLPPSFRMVNRYWAKPLHLPHI